MESSMRWARAVLHPPKYVTACLVVSLGGLLNGLDTGTIGPVTNMPYFTKTFGPIDASVQGIIVSSIMLSAAVASFFAGDVSDSLGRPRSIAIGSLVLAIGAALETAAVNLGMLITGRLIVGAGEGLFLSTLIVYTTEISPPRSRGALCTTVQLFITFGLVVGFFTCYGSVNIASTLSWRLPFAIHTGIALMLFLASCFYLPHSPRWLSYHGRKEEASRVWDELGVSSAEREKDLLQNPTAGQAVAPAAASANESQSIGPDQTDPKIPKSLKEKIAAFAAIFRGKSRRATLLGLFMVSFQQLSGIDGVIYYSPILFRQAGLSSNSANFLASGVSAICIFVFTILAVVFADKWGRRPTTIYGGLILLACMGTIGALYASGSVHGDQGAARWVVIASIYVFAIVYSMTWAIGLRIFASEIQPIATRATATSLAQGANCFTNWFVAFITPILLADSSYGVYMLFSGCLALTIVVGLVYMPETNGKDLETVTAAFANHKSRQISLPSPVRSLSEFSKRYLRPMKAPWGHKAQSRVGHDMTELE